MITDYGEKIYSLGQTMIIIMIRVIMIMMIIKNFNDL
jgi:hypothetical protein